MDLFTRQLRVFYAKLTLALAAAFACFPALLDAQTPGYLGNRITVQARFLSSPAIWGPTANNRGIGAYKRDDFSLGLNWKAQGTVGYTLTRKLEATAGVAFGRTGVIAEFVESLVVSSTGEVTSSYTDVFLVANMTFIELGLKNYNVNNGALAPYGAHIQYLAGAAIFNGEVIKRSDQGNLVTNPESSDLQMSTRCVAPYIGVEAGQNLIFFDRLMLNYGVRLSYPLIPFGVFFFEDPFEQGAAKRFIATNAFSFNVGTGFIF